jgi:hypothetical protein
MNLPSGLGTMAIGRLLPVGMGNSSTLPSGLMRAMALPTSSVHYMARSGPADK